MRRPYSLDFLERLFAGLRAAKRSAVADLYGVSVSCVVKWSLRYRASGSAAPGKMGGHRRSILEKERGFVLARIEENPDLTLRGLQTELAERGTAVSYGAVRAFVHA